MTNDITELASFDDRPGLAAAIQHIQNTAIKDRVSKTPITNTNTTLVALSDGTLRDVIEPAKRFNILNSVADVGRIYDYFLSLCPSEEQPSVWIDDHGVTVIANDSGENSPRIDRASLTFLRTGEFLKILSLDAIDVRTGKQQFISQQLFLKLTRTTFYDAFITPQARSVIQSMLKSMSSNTELGKGALALSTTSREGEFPDYFTLHTRVFNDPVLRGLPRREVRIHIEILPQGQGFELTPNAQDIAEAVYTEVVALQNILRGDLSEEARLFFGSPEERNLIPTEE